MTPAQLKAERTELGLSQAQLAEELGVPPNTVARWERGDLAIRAAKMLALAMQSIRRRIKG